MTARYLFVCLAGTLLVATALLSLGAASAQDAPAFGSGSALVDPPVAQPSPPKPSDALHDPITDPRGAIDDARTAKQEGWPLLAILVLIAISRGLATARKKWPASKLLGWMGGKVGLVVIGVGVVATAAFDALALGGSGSAVGYAVLGSALSLIVPQPAKGGV